MGVGFAGVFGARVGFADGVFSDKTWIRVVSKEPFSFVFPIAIILSSAFISEN